MHDGTADWRRTQPHTPAVQVGSCGVPSVKAGHCGQSRGVLQKPSCAEAQSHWPAALQIFRVCPAGSPVPGHACDAHAVATFEFVHAGAVTATQRPLMHCWLPVQGGLHPPPVGRWQAQRRLMQTFSVFAAGSPAPGHAGQFLVSEPAHAVITDGARQSHRLALQYF